MTVTINLVLSRAQYEGALKSGKLVEVKTLPATSFNNKGYMYYLCNKPKQPDVVVAVYDGRKG